MKLKIAILFILFGPQSNLNAQKSSKIEKDIVKFEKKIDSLNNEMIKIQSIITNLRDSITKVSVDEKISKALEINDGKGIEVIARVEQDFGPFILFGSLGKSEIGKIPINSIITVYKKVENYYKVEYRGKMGFILANYLKLDPKVKDLYIFAENTKLNQYNFSSSAKSQPIQTSNSPPIQISLYKSIEKNQSRTTNCETVQCTGITKKGKGCKNRTKNCWGRCHLH